MIEYAGLVQFLQFKEGVNPVDLLYLPFTLNLMLFNFCVKAHEIHAPQVVVTRIIGERLPYSTTGIHGNARAIDLRSNDWTYSQVEEMVNYITNMYKDCGAIGRKSHESVPIYHHGATKELLHFHLQVRPGTI